MDRELIFVITVTLGIIFLCVTVLGCGMYFLDKAQCQSFGNLSNREVKFVKYTPFSWDCLTPTKDGKFISANLLREI